jgi:hypothetical protein
MPFGNGLPERRKAGDHPRAGGNRDDDPDLDVARRAVRWTRWIATKHLAVTLVASALASVATWVAVSLMLAPRVAALEHGMVSVKHDLAAVQADVTVLKNSEEAKLYMLCALHERAIPNAILPQECRDVRLPHTP